MSTPNKCLFRDTYEIILRYTLYAVQFLCPTQLLTLMYLFPNSHVKSFNLYHKRVYIKRQCNATLHLQLLQIAQQLLLTDTFCILEACSIIADLLSNQLQVVCMCVRADWCWAVKSWLVWYDNNDVHVCLLWLKRDDLVTNITSLCGCSK